MVVIVAERVLGNPGPLDEETDLVLVGHADTAVHLNRLVAGQLHRLAGFGLGQRCMPGEFL